MGKKIPALDEGPLEFMNEVLKKDYEFFKASGGIDALIKAENTFPEIILRHNDDKHE